MMSAAMGYKVVTRCRAMLLLLCICLVAGCNNAQVRMHEEDPGPPVRGGTLEILDTADVSHLATTSADVAATKSLLRAFTRTLVTFQSSNNFERATRLVPDLALEVPSRENGGISADGLTYVFHLRRGVRWNTNPPREVTAHDFVRAFKLFGNPVCPIAVPGWYDCIVGLEDYCSRFARATGTVPAIRDFVNTKEIEGVRATDDFTLVFRLLHPATYFLNVLADTFASPVPVEYLDYPPDGPEFRQHTLSIGPYRITRYIRNREVFLERNPVWDPATDPVRPGYVDRIRLRFGMDDQLQQLQIAAGTADMSNVNIPTAELASLMAINDPMVWLSPPGDSWAGFRYLDINHIGPGPIKHLRVRQAIALAVDKAALVQLWGGTRVAQPLRRAVSSSVSGYQEGADQYVTPQDRGNPAEARALLAAAGYPNGISLRLAYENGGRTSLLAQSLQAGLARAGIIVELTPMTLGDLYGRLLAYPENARRGEWDIATDGLFISKVGENGRQIISPLFEGRLFGQNSWNCGGYNNPEVDALIDRATTAGNIRIAKQAWSEAARRAMEDVALVPLVEVKDPFAHSRRLRNCTWAVVGRNCDITSVWLAGTATEKRSLP
jgi:ABC-type transport system substrate-binding protein